MSSLQDRLSRLKSNTSPARPRSAMPSTAEPSDEWRMMNVRLEHSDCGHFLLRERRFPMEYRHGHYIIGQLVGQADELCAFGGGCPSLSHENIIFFDTETTGLGVGAGNVPFMIGIGFYEIDEFVVEQLFIRNPGEELAMLAYLQEKLNRFSHVVSYNGKTFDWPLLKNRYILNRLPFRQDEGLIQLDFLYPSRSLWRNTLPSCRLGKVEEDRLGIVRTGDVPGSLAPTLYFQYLASGDPATIEGVFLHNERDILSLASLAIHYCFTLSGRFQLYDMDCEEVFRLGLWLDKMGKHELSETVFEQLLRRPSRELAAHFIPLAQIFKKKGDYERAVDLWKRCIEDTGPAAVFVLEPLVELAMYYEHKRKDFDQALAYAEEALNKAWKRLSATRGNAKHRDIYDQMRKRVDRLRRKQVYSI
jgi:uncharacterized protein YprB with RNaseH-like and TPR domain